MIHNSSKILLHSCCAPCLTAVHEKISGGYRPVIFWFNPNIEPKAEYDKRLATLQQFSNKIGAELIIGMKNYEKENAKWLSYVEKFADEPEGGQRCKNCIEFRLKRTAKQAKELGLIFATTLSVSPHKNAEMINSLGKEIAKGLDLEFLEGDFKKQDGYLRSIKLSKEFNLYRQNYCGCRFSASRISVGLFSKKFERLVNQKRRPDNCLEHSEHSHPKSGGDAYVIHNRADKSESINSTA